MSMTVTAADVNIKKSAENSIFKVKVKVEVEGGTADVEKAKSPYRAWDEFIDFALLEENTTRLLDFYLNKVFKAKEKKVSRAYNADYEENSYHIAFRKSEFEAQVDRALSKIYRHFLGYGPEVDIIKKGQDFYVASRTIRGFHNVSVYDITPEGVFKKNNKNQMRLKGLASILAIAYFFGEPDFHSANWGIQENGSELLCYKIDNAYALSDEILSVPITNEAIKLLIEDGYFFRKLSKDADPEKMSVLIGSNLLGSSEFRKEFFDMLEKIASCDFNIIAKIIKDNITTDKSFVAKWYMEKISSARNKGADKISEETGMSVEECEKKLRMLDEGAGSGDPKTELDTQAMWNANSFIKLLESRQLHLRFVLMINKSVNEALFPVEKISALMLSGQYNNKLVPDSVPISTISFIITDYALSDEVENNERENCTRRS